MHFVDALSGFLFNVIDSKQSSLQREKGRSLIALPV
jgi:hypothetical protein